MKSIKETLELVSMLGAIASKLITALKDGKISLMESLSLLSLVGTLRTGFQGISEVRAEMADLDTTERAELSSAINQALTDAGLSHRIADASELVLDWAYGSIRTFIEVRAAPFADGGEKILAWIRRTFHTFLTIHSAPPVALPSDPREVL